MKPFGGRARLVVCFLGLAVAGVAQPAAGQQDSESFRLQQRQVDQRLLEEFDAAIPPAQRVSIDWGGWYNYFGFLFDDGIESSRTFRRNDVRLWGNLSADGGAHTGYVRARLSYVDFNAGDSFDGNDDDWEGPNLERGWYQFRLNRALKAYGGSPSPVDFNFKIGRQYVEFGTGYALSMPMDALQVTAEAADFQVTGLMGAAIRSFDNIDASHPNAGDSERNFFGVQVKYLGFERHEPFVYTYWNEDKLRKTPIDPFQNYDYDSYYIGFGSLGEIVPNLRYRQEWVFEHGRSFGDRMFLHHDDINAWGWDMLLEYLMPVKTRPRFLAEYMFASGDPDRLGSPTNARGGNTRGDDTSFVGFGYRDTGLSFAPRLSNIHIWRTGASFFPFEDIAILRSLEAGTDWFLYWKNRRQGALSDPLADQRSGYAGWEMDYFTNWRITSDLAITVRYGVYFPGSAFTDQTTRTFLLTGVTYSF